MHTVLVVDDDPLVARALSRALGGRRDRRILTSTCPYEALTVVEEEAVDVVISDKDMPGMSGMTLLALVRERCPGVVRILITGHASLESALDAINREQVYKYVTKPWDDRDLEATVSGALAQLDSLRAAAQAAGAAERRRVLLAELEREFPGISGKPEGAHQPQAGQWSDRVEVRLAELAGDPHSTLPASDGIAPTPTMPLEIADALLMVPLRHAGAAVVIEPNQAGHQVSVETGAAVGPLLTLPRGAGDTVAARLALLGGLDVSSPGQQLGRLSVSNGQVEIELMVALRTSALGLAVELRRLARVSDSAPVSDSVEMIGKYRVICQLGEGGLGKVYRAVHTSLERPVAVKVLRTAAAKDPMSMARFLREARAASRARHPGIVEMLDTGQLADGRPFLVMELVEAPTLEQRLAERGPMSPAEAICVATRIAEALGAAHAAGVVHRDLKPENIFVDDDLSVKIADFGAAKLLGALGPELTMEGMTIGTPHYMSPEHSTAQPVDRRTDLYALGCVLFEMLAGRPPFDGDTPREILLKHVQAPLPPVTSPAGPLPMALSRAVYRAMAKQAAERHQTAAELIADLEQARFSLGRTGWRRWLP